MEELKAFIQSNPDPRELKRALAVKMTLQGYPHREIQDISLIYQSRVKRDRNCEKKVSELKNL